MYFKSTKALNCIILLQFCHPTTPYELVGKLLHSLLRLPSKHKYLSIMVVYYTLWQLLWSSPLTYILTSLRFSDVFRSYTSAFQGTVAASFNIFSLSLMSSSISSTIPHFTTTLFSEMNNSRQIYSERHLAMSADIAKAVQIQSLKLDHYLHRKTTGRWIKLGIHVAVCAKLMKHHTVPWPSRFETIATTMRAACSQCSFSLPSTPYIRQTRLLCTMSTTWSCWRPYIAWECSMTVIGAALTIRE